MFPMFFIFRYASGNIHQFVEDPATAIKGIKVQSVLYS